MSQPAYYLSDLSHGPHWRVDRREAINAMESTPFMTDMDNKSTGIMYAQQNRQGELQFYPENAGLPAFPTNASGTGQSL